MTTVCPSAADPVQAAISTHHISVCICTLRRPELLNRTLRGLENQKTNGLFTYSLVVADNDRDESARGTVDHFVADSKVDVRYCVEPEQNIALARNRAVESAHGDFVAFIDDDEFPMDDWLLNLLKTCEASGADGVLGPVKPFFDFEPAAWVRRGKFFERPAHKTGYKLSWEQTRTGNVLFKREILNDLQIPFRSQFASAGEDMDFFRRAMEKGRSFVWCNEAVAQEVIPQSRCTRGYLLKRALLRGSNFPKHPTQRFQNLVKSMLAVPAYALILPLLLLGGQHVFLKYLIKLCDHGSRILAFLGVTLVAERQT